MNNPTKIQTPKANILVISVFDFAYEYQIRNDGKTTYLWVMCHDNDTPDYMIGLEGKEEDYEVLGEIWNGEVKFDCGKFLLRARDDDSWWYPDYTKRPPNLKNRNDWNLSKEDSFLSLLLHHHIDVSKGKFVCLLKNNKL